jgi:2-octaprenylphenol hydroxylase
LSTGPLAFLPLQNPQASSIVWSLPSELATQYAAMPSHNLISILEKACSKQLGDIQTISKSFLFPLVYRRVNQYVKDRIVLIGDAAHTIHPMAGQGINMGLLDAAYLLDVLQEAKFDLSCKQLSRYLRSYERARKADNDIMLKSVHLLHRLFANKINAVQSARSLGLNMTAQCTWLKNQFTRHAIGDRMGMPMLTKIFEDTF